MAQTYPFPCNRVITAFCIVDANASAGEECCVGLIWILLVKGLLSLSLVAHALAAFLCGSPLVLLGSVGVEDFAGEAGPRDVWEALAADPAAVLVDVRTNAEWSYVGLPDLGTLGRKPVLLAWQLFPDMALNPAFAAELAATVPLKETAVYFLCRSGVRSKAAAKAMTGLGYARCYNVTGGFEGDPDPDRHRGRINGWKAEGLPWVQG